MTGSGMMGHHGHHGMNGGQGNMAHHHHHGNQGNNNNFGRGFFGFPFFGFGYPFFGFGFGYPFFGLGYGLYGLGYGLGYGGLGYGGYGYGGYGYGYGYPYYGYGPYYYGYGPYYYGGGYGAPIGYGVANAVTPVPATTQAPAKSTDAEVFAEKGENDFKAGDYKGAVYAWRHAVVDDPQNGVLLMMLAQGLFAIGNYDEAAGATQQAMTLISDDQWGVVVSNYRELYGKMGDYTKQLRALEKTIKDNPDDPGTRFLLGFHYGYLGYPSQAVKQLGKVIKLQPADQLAKNLRDQFSAKLPKPADDKAQ